MRKGERGEAVARCLVRATEMNKLSPEHPHYPNTMIPPHLCEDDPCLAASPGSVITQHRYHHSPTPFHTCARMTPALLPVPEPVLTPLAYILTDMVLALRVLFSRTDLNCGESGEVWAVE